MRIVEIKALENGAHRNQTINGALANIPDGYAVIPDDMICDNFPFGEVKAEEIDGVMTVTEWIAGEIPEEPEPEPAPEDQTDDSPVTWGELAEAYREGVNSLE